MKAILGLILMVTLQAKADPITESCQRDVRQQTILRAQQKAPKMSTAEINSAINGRIAAAEYVVQADTAVCIADKIKLALASPSNFEYYCLLAHAKTRVECFKAWQEKQDISYAKQVAQLARTAYDMAEQDVKAPSADKKKIARTMVESWVAELERYSPVKNVVYKAGGGELRDHLRRQEHAEFQKAHQKIMLMAQAELSFLMHDSARQPTVAAPAQTLEKSKLVALQQRLVKLRKQLR